MPRDLERSGSKPGACGLPVTPRAQVLRRVPRRSRTSPAPTWGGGASTHCRSELVREAVFQIHLMGRLANKLAPTSRHRQGVMGFRARTHVLERGLPRDLARSGSKPGTCGLPVTPRVQVLRRVPRRSRDEPRSYKSPCLLRDSAVLASTGNSCSERPHVSPRNPSFGRPAGYCLSIQAGTVDSDFPLPAIG